MPQISVNVTDFEYWVITGQGIPSDEFVRRCVNYYLDKVIEL